MGVQEIVLDTIMEFVKVGNNGRFHSAIYHKFLHSIVSLFYHFSGFSLRFYVVVVVVV